VSENEYDYELAEDNDFEKIEEFRRNRYEI
jgi:hypothetical protein